MTYLASGLWTSVPFLAADVGNLGGGAFAGWSPGGAGTVRARMVVMGLLHASDQQRRLGRAGSRATPW